jgi:hypothetical protein
MTISRLENSKSLDKSSELTTRKKRLLELRLISNLKFPSFKSFQILIPPELGPRKGRWIEKK